jgi:hypothetical protein
MNRQQSFIHYLLHNNAILISNYNELIKKNNDLKNHNNELKIQIAKKEHILLEIMEKYDIYPNMLSKT